MNRREFLAAAMAARAPASPTRFQIACMTLPYSAFPLERALSGIRNAGYDFVAWGVNHREASGAVRPALAVDAPAGDAANLAARCRGMGLEPVMMFSTVHLEAANALDAHLRRIDQAAAAKIPFLLTFGKTEPGQYELFIRNLKGMAPRAQAAGVTVVIKQHGGNSATGQACLRIVKEVGEPAVRICYDAGNVLDYENQDPIADIRTCWSEIRAFAIKDHRNWPKDQDCGPGFGEIDHYKLLQPVMRTGLTIPLACENIFEPLVPRPETAEAVDALARRARQYVDAVVRGLAAEL
ncbi:MAG: sugar phosphate isomerase/epimerase family protein [Bryobacteraceae bacterium]